LKDKRFKARLPKILPYTPDRSEQEMFSFLDEILMMDRLEDDQGMSLRPLRYDQTGLRGKLAQVLVNEPTDEIDWPADLPAGTKTVVIVDDTPNPHHTLRVHPPDDPARVALVVYDQLSVDKQ
jgi:hypothetical protein